MTDHDKKISGVEAPMNPVPQQSAPSEGRRRLVKGALAAPAVMTLMHGRLASARSLTCVERAGTPGVGWIDAQGNILKFGTDEDSKSGLGYDEPTGTFDEAGEPIKKFRLSDAAAPSESCLTSIMGG